MMRRSATCTLAAALFGGAVGSPAAVRAQPQWQYLYQPPNQVERAFEIGIRSKFGERPYRATFVVNAPGGRAWSRTIRVMGDAWGKLIFPRDFRAPYRPGRYRYVIVVDGRVAIRARFQLK